MPLYSTFLLCHCRLCQLSYSHILKIENFPQEWDSFLSEIGIKEIKLPWANKATNEKYSVDLYFKQLTEDERIMLYKKFEADFLMFGYSVSNDFYMT